MTTINTKKKVEKIVDVLHPASQPVVATPDAKKGTHLNWMGGPSFDIKNPLTQLKVVAGSCFFGEPSYYQGDAPSRRPTLTGGHGMAAIRSLSAQERKTLRSVLGAVDPTEWRSETPATLMVKAIDAALEYDAVATLEYAAHLRHELHFRTTPQVILVRAANNPKLKGMGLVGKFAPRILERLDEVCTQMAYQLATYGKKIPKSLKRVWASRLEKAKAYELAKYTMKGREVNLFDVINLVHPAGDDINKLMKGELKLGTDGRDTWESIRSAGGSWAEAVKVMGHMALLKNLRNLGQDTSKPLTKDVLTKLVQGAPTGKQLPFRYFSAYKAVEALGNAQLLDALEECLVTSLGMLPQFPGKVASLVDNSGSARGATTSSLGSMTMAEIGNLMGLLTARVSDEGHVGVFGDALKMVPIQKRTGFFDELKKINQTGDTVGQATEHGIWCFWRDAIEKKQHWDTVFIYSDMQAGHGGLYGTGSAYKGYVWGGSSFGGGYAYIDVPKLIATYRKQVNPNVVVVLVQIAGYQDTLLPEYYDKTVILGGWSPEVLRFTAELMGLNAPVQGAPPEESEADEQ
jgi:hypothetical protein